MCCLIQCTRDNNCFNIVLYMTMYTNYCTCTMYTNYCIMYTITTVHVYFNCTMYIYNSTPHLHYNCCSVHIPYSTIYVYTCTSTVHIPYIYSQLQQINTYSFCPENCLNFVSCTLLYMIIMIVLCTKVLYLFTVRIVQYTSKNIRTV